MGAGEQWWRNKSGEDIRASKAEWLEREKKTKRFEQLASENPRLYASSAFYRIRGTRRHLRRLLRKRFGVKVRYFGFHSQQYVASRKRFLRHSAQTPQQYYDYVQFDAMSKLLRIHDVLWFTMHRAYTEAHRGGEDPDAAACEAFFECVRSGPWAATPTSREEPDGMLREMSAKGVAGFVAANSSLTGNRRYGIVLREIRADFFEELLPAVLLAWDEMQPGEPLQSGSGETNLVSRTQGQLEKLGSEAAEKQRIHEQFDEATRPGQDDGLLKEFELMETMRLLEQEARLSQQEAEVWQRHRQGMEDAEIAAELKITANNAYVAKHNATKKLIEARKAAGL